MKKTLLLSLLLAGAFVVFPLTDASAQGRWNPQRNDYQWQRQNRGRHNGWWNKNRNHSRVSTTYQTRYVRIGRALYKETYQVRYLPNGRTQSRLVSRVRTYSRW